MNGRIFQRGKYLWIAYYHHGKEQREAARNLRTDEKIAASDQKAHKEAERFLKNRLCEVTAEKHGGPAFVGTTEKRITVNDLLDSLEADYKLRSKDSAQFKSHLKRVRDYFGTWKAIELSADSVAAYIEEMREQEYTNATINRGTQLLGQAYELAISDRKITTAPRIEHLSEVGNERQGFFETADFEAVVQHLPEYLKDFARFGFITGWRKGSIQSLRWTDVTDDVIRLRAENSKTRKAESLPIEGELADIIERRRAAQVYEDEEENAKFSEYVFHLNGSVVGDFRKAWASACKAAKVTAHFHDLRRTAARNMIAAGTPQVVAMKITGHRTDAMFRRYAIVNEEQKRDALARTQQHVAATAAVRKVVSMKGK